MVAGVGPDILRGSHEPDRVRARGIVKGRLQQSRDLSMTTLLLLIMFGYGAVTGQQETPKERKVPKDSVRLSITGCLKGRVLAVSDVRRPDTESGPIVRARSFRLAGKGDVMDDVKREDGHLVDVTGLVRRSALIEPGVRIGKRIVVGGGSPVAGGSIPSPAESVPVLDVWTVQQRSASCGSGN